MNKWISAFRLRTLPLSLSSIIMGNFLAFAYDRFNWIIGVLTILTTVFLQVLSNLANDYGDSIHGADHKDRQGPKRAVQAGLVTLSQMKRAVVITATLSLISGLTLLLYVFSDQWLLVILFLTLGLLSIYAAVTYTAGSHPYGYLGLGDISVFIFFGLVGVCGSYYLQVQDIHWTILLPAATCGFFATGVLNVNNIRDIKSDQQAGKRSIPVRIGRAKAVIYHSFLLIMAWICSLSYVIQNFENWTNFLFVLSLPLFVINIKAVATKTSAPALDPYLKQLALSTLLFVILFGLGWVL